VFGLLAPGPDGGVGAIAGAIVFEQLGAHLASGPILWSTLAAPFVAGAPRGDRLVGGVEADLIEGEPLVVADPDSPTAQTILRIAEEIHAGRQTFKPLPVLS